VPFVYAMFYKYAAMQQSLPKRERP